VLADLRRAAEDLVRGDLASATAGIAFREISTLIGNASRA
jgi:hypothetical protein